MLPRLDARRALTSALPVAGFLLPLAGLGLALSCAPHTSALVLARLTFLAILGIALAATAGAGGGARLLAQIGAGIGVLASLEAIWQGCAGLASQARMAETLPGPLRELVLARLGSGRVFGPFLLPASLGGALAITLPLTVALARPAVGRRRLAWIAGALVQSLALVWSISLGAWIALAGAGAIVALGPLARARRGRWALAGGLALAAMAVAGGVVVRARLLPAAGPEDRPLAYRSGNWTVAAEMIADHPFLGTGPGTFGEMFPLYRREGMNESRYAHCSYVQLVAELGIGIVPFLLLVPLAAAGLVRRGAAGGALGVAASVGALSFLIHNLVDFTFYQPAVGALFVLAVAIATRPAEGAAAAGVAASERSGTDTETEKGPVGRARWSGAHALVLAASLVAGAFLIVSGVSDLSRERAVVAHEVGAPQEVPLLERAIRLDPFDPEPRGDLAAVLASHARAARRDGADAVLDRALFEARTAARLDVRTPFRHNEIVRIELMKGHPGAAWVELARAASLYPLKTEYRRDLAALGEKLFASPTGGGRAAPHDGGGVR